MRRTLAWALLLALLIGCGGGDTKPTPPANPDTPPAVEPGDTPTDTPTPSTAETPTEPATEAGTDTGTPEAPAASAGPAAAAANGLDLSYIAADFSTAVVIHPGQLLSAPILQPYLEMEESQDGLGMAKAMGIDPAKIERIVLLVPADATQMLPMLMGSGMGPSMGPGDDMPPGMGGFEEFEQVEEFEESTPSFDPMSATEMPMETNVAMQEFGDEDMSSGSSEPSFGEGDMDFGGMDDPGMGGPMMGPPEMPAVGIIITMSEPTDLKAILDGMAGMMRGGTPFEQSVVEGKTCYNVAPEEPHVLVCQADETTVLIGSEAGMALMLGAPAGEASALTALLGTIDLSQDITIATPMEPYKPLLEMMLAEGGDQVPPPFKKLPEQLKTIALSIDLSGANLATLKLEGFTGDDAAALTTMATSLKMMGQMAIPALASELPPEAGKQGVNLATSLLNGMNTNTVGSVCTVAIAKPADFDQTVQEMIAEGMAGASKAADNVADMNRMRMVAIGIMSLVETYGSMPSPAIGGPDGLSWRAGILKFLEEEATFGTLDLSKGWQDPANAAAAQTVVDAYATGGATDSKTTIMLITGPGTLFPTPTSRPKLVDVTDGASDTILAVLVSPRHAVPWIQPTDVVFDPANPAALMNYFDGPEFLAVMCDGSVQQFPTDLAPETIKALVSPAAGDQVDWSEIDGGDFDMGPGMGPDVDVEFGPGEDMNFGPGADMETTPETPSESVESPF